MTVFDWQVYRYNLDVLLFTNLKHLKIYIYIYIYIYIIIVSVLIRWDAIWPVNYLSIKLIYVSKYLILEIM
jgi:hypothetical protein